MKPRTPLLLTLLWTLPALAQNPTAAPLQAPAQTGPALRAAPRDPVAHPPHVATPGKNPATVAETRAKLRDKIRAIRSRKLAEVIQPDPASMLKLAEVAEKFEEQLEQARGLAQTTRKELLKATQAAKPDEATVLRLTAQLISQRSKLAEIEVARENAVRAVLKPVEFAKLVLAWPKINREIREEIYRVLLKKKARDVEI